MNRMTELEDRLAEDSSGALRAELLERLEALEHRMRVRIGEGMLRNEYETTQKAAEAAAAARAVIASWPSPAARTE